MTEEPTPNEDQYLFALNDVLARMDVIQSAMIEGVTQIMNGITNLSNTRNYYLKLIGQIQKKSISSK